MQGGQDIRGHRFLLSESPASQPDPVLAAQVARAAPAPGDSSLAHARLPGGTALLCHTPRADVVHALLVPSGALRRMWAIDLWRAPVWQGSWEGPDGVPTLAPGAEPEPGARFSAPELVEFASLHAARVRPFLSDVRRLFTDPAGRQVVVAERDQATVARWIALAAFFLDHCRPASPGPALTFTTGTRRPLDAPQQILGIGPDAEFDRSDIDLLSHRYRVHDGLGGPGSPPEEHQDPLAARFATDRLGLPPERPARPRPAPDGGTPNDTAPNDAAPTPVAPGAADPLVRTPASPVSPTPPAPAPPADEPAPAARPRAADAGPPPAAATRFQDLLAALPGGRPADAAQLEALYRRVWGRFDPDLAGALTLVRGCAPELLIAARIHLRIVGLLTRPAPVTRAHCDLARELLARQPDFDLHGNHLAAARLLIAGHELAAGGERAKRAARDLQQLLLGEAQPLINEDQRDWARRRLREYGTDTLLGPGPHA